MEYAMRRLRPGGTFEISPAVHCWGNWEMGEDVSPGGTVEAAESPRISVVPTGLSGMRAKRKPSDESLG
jgi:hypothetical protein